jgi:hypothetical protein
MTEYGSWKANDKHPIKVDGFALFYYFLVDKSIH